MTPDLKDVTLETVGGGAAVPQFEQELERVLENIRDPNTEAKATRKITLTVTFDPEEDRETVHTSIQVKSKLAPQREASAPMYIGFDRRDGALKAKTHDLRQRDMFSDGEEEQDVVPINDHEREKQA